MLPYRLRLPNYGAKLKKQKESESFLERTHPYREGGPYERAIKADLTALFPKFEELVAAGDQQLQQQDGDECITHLPEGTAFRAFKQVFGGARVAMLHRRTSPHATTGFLPQRCDRNAYSQLLYAVCFSLLRDAFNTTTSTSETVLNQASFAVFNMYALYETNPLPRAPITTEEWLALLPIGLQNRENPRFLYRRAFRQSVRIDLEHYGYLLRLRDLARAAQARCQQQQCFATRSDQDASAASWKCECAVATDVGVVLDRILLSSAGVLELCAYTGPCGLEGLAGHADYPFPATIGTATTRTTNEGESLMQQAPHELEPLHSASEPFSSELEDHLAAYLASRRTIRLPAVNSNMSKKEKRIRDALMPIFSQDDEHGTPINDPLTKLLAGCRGKNDNEEQPQKRIKLRHRHVTFGTVFVNDASGGTQVEKLTNEKEMDDVTTSASAPLVVAPQPPFELILPSSLSSEQHSSLQDAVQSLLDRDDSLLLPLEGMSLATPSHVERLTNDGVSTLGDGLVSTVGSTIADGGRAALRDLLSRVKVPMTSAGEAIRARSAGQFFLASSAAGGRVSALPSAANDGENLSDLSSDDENDEVSVAASRVGQRALQKLLSAAGGEQNRTKQTTKTSATNSLQHNARHSNSDVVQASASYPFTERRGESDNSEDDSSMVSSGEGANQGRDALNALLSRAHRANGTNAIV